MQQILAYETDLLEYGDLFDGSKVMTRKVEELKAEAKEELKRIEEMGGAIAAVETGYMKRAWWLPPARGSRRSSAASRSSSASTNTWRPSRRR